MELSRLSRLSGLSSMAPWFGRGSATQAGLTTESLEDFLIGHDVGPRLAAHLAASATKDSRETFTKRLQHDVVELLRKLEPTPERTWDRLLNGSGRPHTILVLGVNGSGKTTNLAKVARHLIEGSGGKKRVMLAGCDTWRAAAMDQLASWAQRIGAEFFAGEVGGDPAASAYRSVETARAASIDYLLVDTAGRLGAREDLRAELAKVDRTLAKLSDTTGGLPGIRLLVLDGTAGLNAIEQVRWFKNAVDINSILVTKLDGSARAGFLLQIADQEKNPPPVHFLSVGESLEDLVPFDATEFASRLVGGSETDQAKHP